MSRTAAEKTEQDNEMLFARLDDLCGRAEGGIIGHTCFLSPREQHFAAKHLKESGFPGSRVFFYGGFGNAERKRLFVLPDYIPDGAVYEDICMFGGDCIGAVRIDGSSYRTLCHRDFLGSVLGLGLERGVTGDIVTDADGFGAVVVCDRTVIPFIVSELKKVATDTVKVSEYTIPPGFEAEHRFIRISDTVASARIDCIVAALCNLSREKARREIESGNTEIEFETETRPDRLISEPCTLSVRGYGRFRVNSVSDVTRKGRLRLDADKFI